jgi:hypothetical protein
VALWERATELGLEVSLRTVQRVWRGEIKPAQAVVPGDRRVAGRRRDPRRGPGDGPVLTLGEQERGEIADILRRAASASYLELGELRLETRPGEVNVRARVYEPEEEYE